MRPSSNITLSAEALATVLDWQRVAGSLEVCGLLAVDGSGRQQMLLLTNHAGLTGAFEVSRSESRLVRAAAAQRGWGIVAFVHTHPYHPPALSARDAQCFERDDLPWIIVGNAASDPVQRTYARAGDSRFTDHRRPQSASQSE